MSKHFLKHIAFEHWANTLTIQAITEAKEPSERTLQLLGHIVATYSTWLHRILDQKPTLAAWNTLTLEECRQLNEANHTNWTEYVANANEHDFERQVSFSFFGEPSTISIADIFTHSINHGSYHRGQIIALLKGKLEPLPLTTYIAFAKIRTLE